MDSLEVADLRGLPCPKTAESLFILRTDLRTQLTSQLFVGPPNLVADASIPEVRQAAHSRNYHFDIQLFSATSKFVL